MRVDKNLGDRTHKGKRMELREVFMFSGRKQRHEREEIQTTDSERGVQPDPDQLDK